MSGEALTDLFHMVIGLDHLRVVIFRSFRGDLFRFQTGQSFQHGRLSLAITDMEKVPFFRERKVQ